MPKVTLLKEAWSEYSVVSERGKMIRLIGGEARSVSAALAQRLRKERKVDGSPLFLIVDDPIVVPAPAPPSVGVEIIPPGLTATIERACKSGVPEQHVLGTLRQLGLKDVAL